MTRAYETSGGMRRGRGHVRAATFEYRHVEAPASAWLPTSHTQTRTRLTTREYDALLGGSMGEHTSRDGLLVFRRRREA